MILLYLCLSIKEIAILMGKRLYLALLACVVIIQSLASQNNIQTDSLLHVLRLTHDNRAKARLLLLIAQEEEVTDPKNSLKFARQALQAAQTAGFDTAEVRAMILMGANYSRMMLLQEAIETGEKIVAKATKYNMELEVAYGRGIMAVAYAQVGDFDNSSKLYFENLKLYEKLNEKRLLGRTMGNIGADFLEQQSYEKALDYSKRALLIGLETNHLTLVTDQYNNIAAIYQVGYNDYSKALVNYFEALKVAKKIDDSQQQGGIMLNIGRIYMIKNNFDSAFYYFSQSLSIFQKLNNPMLVASSYAAIGNYYFKKGDYSEGKIFAINCLEISKNSGILQTISEAADLLHKICLIEKDTIEAYRYLVIRTQTNDSLYTLQSQKQLFKLEFQYNQDKIAKEQKIKQLRYYFIFGFIILGLLSGLVIAILLNSRQKIRIKNTVLEKDKAESNLKFKNKELSINLMALLKKNDLIAEVSQKLAQLEKVPGSTDIKDAVIKLNHEIKQSSDDRLWQEFSVQFKETNSEFYSNLLKKYPELSQSELKLCAYLRLNMTTKEIADLTGQSIETLGKARYRLRKKFGLTNTESNLVTFLSNV